MTDISTDMVEARYADAVAHAKEIGISSQVWSNIVIVHEALARGVSVEGSARGTGMVLRHEGRTHRYKRGHHSLNSRLANRAAKYKEVSSRLLLNAAIAAPENALFQAADEERAWAWGEPLAPLVVKPHDGIAGRQVYVRIETKEDFVEAFRAVASHNRSILVEQFRTGVEHRFLVADGEVIAVTRRRAASVLGDGRSTVTELVRAKNNDRGVLHKQIKLRAQAARQLDRQGLDVGDVPAEGRRVYLRATSNLHTGGDAIDATDGIAEDERRQVQAAAKAMPGLRVAGFDVLLPRNPGDDPQSILEVNHNPMISMHHFPWEGQSRDAAGAVLDLMFPATRIGWK